MINLTDENLPELNSKATKIQRMVRRKRRQEQQQIENQFNENTAQFLDEEQARFNDLDQLFRNDTASRRIQATLKRKLTAIKNQKDLSATKIQTNYRLLEAGGGRTVF
jgi:hypothetical protein